MIIFFKQYYVLNKYRSPRANVSWHSLHHNITIGIKTFQRQESLQILVNSIRRFSKDIKILISNDGKPVTIEDDSGNTVIYNLPWDVGVSIGRNYIVNKTETEYFWLLDDDSYVPQGVDLRRLLNVMQRNNLDVLGGHFPDRPLYNGIFKIEDEKFKVCTDHLRIPIEPGSECFWTQRVLQMFLAKTSSLKQHPWDDELKMEEHDYFFYMMSKANARIADCMDFIVEHHQTRNLVYNEYRFRDYWPFVFKKLRVKEFVKTCDFIKKTPFVKERSNLMQ